MLRLVQRSAFIHKNHDVAFIGFVFDDLSKFLQGGQVDFGLQAVHDVF
jgi:hypothetical protein